MSTIQVETFEQEDQSHNEANTLACDAQAAELIEQLGLKGQKALMNPATVTRLPYRAMTRREQVVYEALCPQKARLEEFRAEIIPVRVLQVAAHAKSLDLFTRLEVWSAETAAVKDPVLVGWRRGAGQYEWEEGAFILARWGRELLPFDKLERLAVTRVVQRRTEQITHAIARLQAALAATSESMPLEKMAPAVDVSGID